MGLTASILNWWYRHTWSEAADGLELSSADAWSVACDGEIEASNVYRKLGLLLPDTSNICLEVVSPSKEIREILAHRVASETSVVKPGTLWPKTSFFHLPATPDVLDELAQLAEKHNAVDMGHHLYAYKDNHMLLQWHDFPHPDGLLISADLASEAVQDFCSSIGCVPVMVPDLV